MTAKDYLLQVRRKKNRILDQEDYVERIRSALGIQAIRYDKEPVQKTPDPHQREHLFTKLYDAEIELEKMKKDFELFQIKVIDMIHSLDEYKYKKLLYLTYIDMKTLKQVSEEMLFSYDYIRELHRQSLDAFEDKFPHLSC